MDFVGTRHFGCRSCKHLGREVNQTPIPTKEGHVTSTFWEQGNLAVCENPPSRPSLGLLGVFQPLERLFRHLGPTLV